MDSLRNARFEIYVHQGRCHRTVCHDVGHKGWLADRPKELFDRPGTASYEAGWAICRSSPVIFHRAPDLSFAHDELFMVKTITDRGEEGYI